MKKLVIAIGVMVCLMPTWARAQTVVTEMIKIGEGRYWLPPPSATTRSLPVQITTTGTVAGTAWWRVGLSWASIAIIAGSVAIDTYNNGTGIAAIDDFLNKYGLIRDGTQWKKANGTTWEPDDPQAAVNLGAYCTSHGWVPYRIFWWSTNAEATANQGSSPYWEQYYTTSITGGGNFGGVLVNCVNRHNGHTGTCTAPGSPGTQTIYFIHAYGTARHQVPNYENRTTEQAQSDIRAAWGSSTGDATDKAAWEHIEQAMKDQMDTDPNGGIMANVNPNNSKTTNTNLKEGVQSAIDNSGGRTDDQGASNQQLSLLDKIWKAIVEGFTGVKQWIGFNDAPADVTNTGIDANENETVLDEPGTATEIQTKQAETTGILDNLWDSVTNLRGRVETKLGSMINQGSGVCSVSFEFYGTHSISFCDIDWTIPRAVIICVATMAAVLIVII